MPVVEMTLPDVAQAVSRPVILAVVKQIQEITKIDKDTKVFYPGETQRMQQPGSTVNSTNRDALMTNNQILFIEAEEDYEVDAMASTAVNYLEQNPVFNDFKLGVSITPIYVTTNVTINFRYRTQSKAEALRWRDDIRVRVSHMRDVNLHNLTYHYLIPMPYLELLKTIHALREETAGYGDTFAEYVISNASDRLTMIGDMVNKDARLGISETQARVVGIFGFEGVPEKPERDDANGTWTITFSYKFTYERPAACNIRYPILVHNQLLPIEYTDFVNDVEDPEKKNNEFTLSLKALNYFENTTQFKTRINPYPIVNIPDFDQFMPTAVPPGTSTVYYVLCTFDPATPNLLVDLNDLGDMIMDDDIMAFIRQGEYQYITKSYRSILQLHLYRGDNLASDTAIECHSDGTVHLAATPNLRVEHRLRLSMMMDTSLLDRASLERLRAHPKVLAKMLIAMNESLKNHPRLILMIQRNYVTEGDMREFFRFLQGIDYNGYRGNTQDRFQSKVTALPRNPLLPTTHYRPGYEGSAVDLLVNVRNPYFKHYMALVPQRTNIQTGYIVTKRAD
jgi:hypothetical protein